MKKFITILAITFITCISSKAADTEDSKLYFDGIENHEDIHLSPKQLLEINQINNKIVPKFNEASTNFNEQNFFINEKLRDLALKHKLSIQNILTYNQMIAWRKKQYGFNSGQDLVSAIIDDMKTRQAEFDKDCEGFKKEIISSQGLTTVQKKSYLKILDKVQKSEKKRLEKEKRSLRRILLSMN